MFLRSSSKTLANRLGAPYTTAAAANSWPRLKPKGEYTPVFVALGLILLSVSLGAHTAKQQLMHSPTVRVKKSRRETVPEVTDPDRVEEETEKFLARGFFRRVAHIQDSNARKNVVPDSIRKDVYAHRPRCETLKSVGVDPRAA
ncbi:hypothetical protein MLD38_002602 [Melastoma candidum]|uniref:Uncharacterized protein n=1 Tax=Melastoma candidum TaxID=119954 RepID=A0ACB9RZW4_9MYRT|nr:hypothetical protein MLD38_002602 [Melastoma candidum]